MPYSNKIFDNLAKNIIEYIEPKKVLDIGAGAGKYGLIVRDIEPNAHIIGVEIERDYIIKYNLSKVYNEIRCDNAACLIDGDCKEKFDLVIFGDVLEHMKKSTGLDLLNFFIYRSKFILIVYPEKYLQDNVDNYKHEAHISVWSEADFINFAHTSTPKQDRQRLIIIKGYIPAEKTLEKVKKLIKNYCA